MGRRRIGRATCEDCAYLDARQLHREGRLLTCQSFSYAWTRGGEAYGGINIRTDKNDVALQFRCKGPGDPDWKLVDQTVSITWTECALGGHRPWFVCNFEINSGMRCQRRAAKIYLGGHPVFACRQCQRLSYASQNETSHLRLIGKAMKIRMRLGGSPNLFMPFPERPKGLHKRTYERLRKIHDAADSRLSG
jgi:hypothetical protein